MIELNLIDSRKLLTDTMEWVNFKVKDGEREKLKNDAYAHRMNISEYLRWLIDKQRKEDEGK